MATFPLPTIGNSKIFPFKLYVASMRSFGIIKSKLNNFFSKSKLDEKMNEKNMKMTRKRTRENKSNKKSATKCA